MILWGEKAIRYSVASYHRVVFVLDCYVPSRLGYKFSAWLHACALAWHTSYLCACFHRGFVRDVFKSLLSACGDYGVGSSCYVVCGCYCCVDCYGAGKEQQ